MSTDSQAAQGAGLEPAATSEVRHDPAPGSSRADVLWSRKWIILAAAVLVAVACGLVALTRPAQYEAQATVRVSLLQTKDVGAQNAIAANEYAAQYAQIVTSEPVLNLAARTSGTSASEMRRNVAVSPLNKYNVIGITATFGSAEQAGRVATALAEAITQYAETSSGQAITSVLSSSSAGSKALDDSIKTAQREVTSLNNSSRLGTTDSTSAALASARSYLASLMSIRQTLYQAPARELRQSTPFLTVLNSPRTGSRQPQRVLIYTVVGALVGGVLAAEFFLLLAQSAGRRRR